MRQAIWSVLLLTGMAQVGWGQTSETRLNKNAEEKRPEASATNYTVQGATPEQESVLRDQIQIMRPKVLPYRIRFVSHWQYIYAARMYQPCAYRADQQNVYSLGQPERVHRRRSLWRRRLAGPLDSSRAGPLGDQQRQRECR